MKGPKKGLALLLEGPSEKSDEAPESGEMEADDTFEDAAKDAFDAAKGGDAEAFALALKRAIYACNEE